MTRVQCQDKKGSAEITVKLLSRSEFPRKAFACFSVFWHSGMMQKNVLHCPEWLGEILTVSSW